MGKFFSPSKLISLSLKGIDGLYSLNSSNMQPVSGFTFLAKCEEFNYFIINKIVFVESSQISCYS